MALRHVTITVFNSQIDVIRKLAEDERIRYCIAQEEVCPETKKEHIQGYIQFKKPIKFNTVKKLLPPGTHIEKARGTAEENRKYCSKIESRKPGSETFESGEINYQGKRKDILEFTKACDEAKCEADIYNQDELRSVWVKYPGLYKRCKAVRIKPRDRHVTPEVSFYFGAPGVGKTRRVFDEHKDDVYMKDNTKWWDGYEGQRCILIDELETSEHWRIEEMLRFLDRYPYQGQVKGGYVNVNSPFIAITSNKTLNDLYPSASPDQMDALKRRITHEINL